jgi:Lon protease-like protein
VRADFSDFDADLDAAADLDEAEREGLFEGLKAYLDGRGLELDWNQARDAPLEALINSLSMALPFDPPEKQALLEAPGLADRCSALIALMHIGAVSSGDDDGDAPVMQ